MGFLDLPDVPWVALDTETSGLHPDDGARTACVALAHEYEDGRMWSIGLPFDQGILDKLPHEQLMLGSTADKNLPKVVWLELLEWLSRQRIVEHNGKFDTMMMRVGTRHWEGRDLIDQLHWDTMLAQGVLDPKELRALDATCQRLEIGAKKGLDELKAWLKANRFPPNRYDLAPWDLAGPYVVADAEMTASLFRYQRKRIVNELNDTDTYERILREMDLTRSLYMMEKRGIEYDAVKSMEAARVLTREADELERTMPFRCTEAEGKRFFFEVLGLLADRRSDKTGKPSLDEEQVRKFKGEGVEWAAEYAEVTKKRRAVSMWYQGYPEKLGVDGRLRCQYRQGHVKSGRMSVERVQLQAMPKKDKGFEHVPDVRQLVHPREGYGLWNLDLSQAELRVAAKYSGCSLMMRLLSEGADMHGVTCENVLKVDRDDPEWKEKRDIAKRLTFGSIFQIGGETFQATLSKLADIHLPLDECTRLVRNWRQLYPEFGDAYRKAERRATRETNVRLLPNTDYEVLSWFGPRDWPNTAWNRIVQGSLAEFFKLWLIAIEQNWPGYAVLTVHDSVLLEAPLDEGDQLSAEVAAWGAAKATEVFSIEMKVDTDRW